MGLDVTEEKAAFVFKITIFGCRVFVVILAIYSFVLTMGEMK